MSELLSAQTTTKQQPLLPLALQTGHAIVSFDCTKYDLYDSAVNLLSSSGGSGIGKFKEEIEEVLSGSSSLSNKSFVIFLDVDGVLNTSFNSGGATLHPTLLKRFTSLLLSHEDVNIVLSSTWRLEPSYKQVLISRLGDLGVKEGRIVGETGKIKLVDIDTNNIGEQTPERARSKEILEYVKENNFENDWWVAVDDMDLGSCGTRYGMLNSGNFLKVDIDCGLTKNNIESLIELITKPNDKKNCIIADLDKNLTINNGLERKQLESFLPKQDIFRNFKARQKLYNLVSNDVVFLTVYENMIKDVILPYIKTRLKESQEETQQNEQIFYYQYPPTMRIQPGPSKAFGKTHSDNEYGHQPGELNFWLPLTDYKLTKTALNIEEVPGQGEFIELGCGYGEAGMFHGVDCRHFAKSNDSDYTRISIDFRVGVYGMGFELDFDGVDGMKKHGWRKGV